MTLLGLLIVEAVAIIASVLLERLQCYALYLDADDNYCRFSRVFQNWLILNLLLLVFRGF